MIDTGLDQRWNIMRIVIKIPEETYYRIKPDDTTDRDLVYKDTATVLDAVYNAKPLTMLYER